MTSEDSQLPIAKSDSWKMFNQISRRYDMVNDLLSLGLHVAWRQQLIRRFPQKKPFSMVDLATGTADIVIRAAQQCPHLEKAIGIDLAEEMLEVGRQKVCHHHFENIISLQHGDATRLDFENERFDVATIAFGIRNVNNPILTLKEMFRVVKDGGKAFVLEFSLPENLLFRFFHLIYIRTVVPLIGGLLSGNFPAYCYLDKTIEKFPFGERFCKMMEQVGFSQVQAHRLWGGIATIYEGTR